MLKKTPKEVYAGVSDTPLTDEDYEVLENTAAALGRRAFEPYVGPNIPLVTPDMLSALEANNERLYARAAVKKQRLR